MKLHRVVKRSRVPAVLGNRFIGRPFMASTIGPFIFIPGDAFAHFRVYRHELVHVRDWWIGLLLGVGFWVLFRPGVLWLALAPMVYPSAYAVAGFWSLLRRRSWYHDNWFERRARRIAGEPVE